MNDKMALVRPSDKAVKKAEEKILLLVNKKPIENSFSPLEVKFLTTSLLLLNKFASGFERSIVKQVTKNDVIAIKI